MSRAIEAASVAVVGAGAGGALAGLEWMPVVSLMLTIVMFYAGRRDILDRHQADLARVTSKVERLERDTALASSTIAAHGGRLAIAEAELMHRATLSELHAVVGASERGRR